MPNGSMPQILVVDDDPGIRESLGILLTSVGYDVVVQKTALSWIEQFANLVVADLKHARDVHAPARSDPFLAAVRAAEKRRVSTKLPKTSS